MEYPNSGALWVTKEKKHEKAPDMWGSVKIDKHYLLSLIEESDGALIEVKLEAWSRKKQSDGSKYLSLKVNTWKPEGGSKPAPKQDDDGDLPF